MYALIDSPSLLTLLTFTPSVMHENTYFMFFAIFVDGNTLDAPGHAGWPVTLAGRGTNTRLKVENSTF